MRVQLRQRKLAKGRLSLYLDIWIDGRRHYEFLNLHLPKDRATRKEMLALGESIRAKRELEIQSAEHGYVPKFKQECDLIEYFESLARTKHKTWHTVLLHLRDFVGPHGLPMRKVTEKWLQDFEEFMLGRVTPNSANNYLNKLKAALNIAVKQGLISTNPYERIRIVKTEPSQRVYLTADELQRLANAPTSHPEIKRAFLFSCYTGLRLSDVKNLTGKQIQSGQLQYRQKKTGVFEYLPLSPMALTLLGDYQQTDEPIFKLPKSEGGLWTHLQVWVTRAGITKHVSFHVARHTFATLALTHSKDLYLVSKLLGHKDIKHTQIYAKIIDDRKRDAVSMLPTISL
jgi:integrase